MSLVQGHLERESLARRHMDSPYRKEYSFQSKFSPGLLRYDQPEALLEYELAREKEKSRILEERLKNKEIFIAQMKEFQNQLTQAFDESQQELAFYKAKCQQDASIQIRGQIDENTQLRQRIHQLEIEKRKIQEDLRQERSRDVQRMSQISRKSLHKSKTDHSLGPYRESEAKQGKDKTAEVLAKAINLSVDQVCKEAKNIGKFMGYFINMASSCNPQLQKASLKQQLKAGWKWIKTIVRQDTRGKSVDKREESKVIGQLSKILKVEAEQVLSEVQNILHEAKYTGKIVRLVAELLGLPPESSLKHIEKSLKDRVNST